MSINRDLDNKYRARIDTRKEPTCNVCNSLLEFYTDVNEGTKIRCSNISCMTRRTGGKSRYDRLLEGDNNV